MRCLVLVLLAGVLAGCAPPSEELLQLRHQNATLQTDLGHANDNIADLEQQRATLTGRVDELTRISGTLEKEKAVRVDEANDVRQQVRSFVRKQLAAFREFSMAEGFLDYRGGELIKRASSPADGLTLIDTQNLIDGDGTLYGIRGRFEQPGKVTLAVLRPMQERWVVVWTTEPVEVPQPGLQQFDFSLPVSVQAGDLLGYRFAKQTPVLCDQGTGGIVLLDDSLSVGQKLTPVQPDSQQGLACSIGVVGMLGD